MSSLNSQTHLYDNDADADAQREALTDGRVPVAVYGLGKMGLPLASVYADVTGNVVGADIDESVVERINRGESHIEGEPGLPELVESVVGESSLRAVSDPAEAADEARVHVAIVPTLVREDNTTDLSVLEAVVESVADGLEAGDMVIVESTVPPRTCRDVVVPRIEELSGLSLGEFGVAFCPERTNSGRAIEDIRGSHPKIVGGADEESRRVAELIYGEITANDVIPVSDTTTAEAVKVFEGVYRDVNIALANELATHGPELDISVMEAIDAANTQPFCDIHVPGAGVGGHCIPYYPYFLINGFEAETPLLETARDVNEAMPGYTADLLLDGLDELDVPVEGASVLVLGLTYRPGVAEIRETPALPIVERLNDAGADVTAVDPVLDEYEAFESAGAAIASTDAIEAGSYDGVVLVTPQEAFADLDVPALGRDGETLVVVDGRQALESLDGREGVLYKGIGVNA